MHSNLTIRRQVDSLIFAITVIAVFFLNGCSPESDIIQPDEEAISEILIKWQDANNKAVLSQMSSDHNAVYFPPDDLRKSVFTYEIQEFFEAHSEDTFVFEGYLEDIEKTEHGVVIEFSCPLREEDYFLSSSESKIWFRLLAREHFIERFLQRKEVLDFRISPDFYVVAKIKVVAISRIYNVHGESIGEEVELSTDTARKVLASGELVDAHIIEGSEINFDW